MDQFVLLIRKRMAAGNAAADHNKLCSYEVWTLGLSASLNELEQSCYAARRYRESITSELVSQMTAEEKLAYSRHVYFDKNSFIRVFALLDKLGILLNDLLGMRTERIKPHFSYFTVLRNMRESKAHPSLTFKLNALKEKTKEPINRLRKRRNTEIHYMNTEMQDDLAQCRITDGGLIKLENVQVQLNDLAQGLDMVTESLRLTFQYACSLMRSRQA